MKGIKMTYWLVVLLLAAAMLGGCGGSGSSGASNENDEHIKMVQEQKLNIGGKIYATKEVFEKFYGQGEWKKYGVAENIDIVSMEVPNKEGKSKIKLLWTVDTKKKEVDFFKLLARKGDHYSEEPVDWYHLLNNVIAKRLSDGKPAAKRGRLTIFTTFLSSDFIVIFSKMYLLSVSR